MTIAPLYRTMAAWLGTAAVLISAALATATYFFEMERVDEAIVALAAGEARSFHALHPEAFSGAPDDQTREAVAAHQLKRFLRTREVNSEGHFIIAEVYDSARQSLGEASQDANARIEAALSRNEHQFPVTDTPWYDKVTVDGRLFIRVVVRLDNPADSRRPGYFEGVYHVSEARIAAIHDRLLTTVLLVIGVVLSTTLFLVPIILRVNRSLMSLSRRLVHANLETLEVLGNAIAKRDSDTGAHNYRVTIFAIRIAQAIGLSDGQMRELIKGAFLHDVGKIAISDTILLKPGRLTPEEFTVMKQHVAHGVDIVSSASWLHDAGEVVSYHHEKFDGSGYLKGLKGEDIPITARIFAIADVFDALISRRPYKEPLPFDKALAIIEEGAGNHFDPALVTAFQGIARSLYDAFAGREDRVVQENLEALTAQYFRTTGP